MKNIKCLLYLFLITLHAMPVFAQQSTIEQEFKQMQAAYQNNEYLSYDVQYLYAKESAPVTYTDSLKGNCKINRNLYWGQIDHVEYIQTDSLFISVYQEDKVILLNSSIPDWLKTNINWDSVWQRAKEKTDLSISEEEGLRKISMRYHSDSIYKQVDFWYSPGDYRIKRMRYVLRPPQELEQTDEVTEAVSPEEFAIIEIRFSNYSTSSFGKEIFETNRYVEKKEKEFQPSKNYIDYTVLVGSPNLLN